MKKTKVLYIIHGVDKAIAFEWISERLNHDQFELSFILLNAEPSQLKNYLNKREIRCKEFKHESTKYYFLLNSIRLFFYLIFNRPNVIHTHLRDANLLALTLGKFLQIKKRIYTRHHSTSNHTYYPKAVKYDKLFNQLSTDIIAISKNVKQVLLDKETVPLEKITLIHHGFLLKDFEKSDPSVNQIFREKYNPQGQRPVIGVIGRYMELKGIQYIIPAFKNLMNDYPNALLILANAKKGAYKEEIARMLQDLPQKSYLEIEFEENLFALYKLFDVFVHVPVDPQVEAFGQIYIEALAAGIPSIFTLSGVAHEVIKHESNALVVNYRDETSIYLELKRLLGNKVLKEKLILNGKDSIKPFNLGNMIGKLESLYAQ